MISKFEAGEGMFFLIVYALAAVSGGMGGCVVWSYYTRKSERAAALILAYGIIGVIFGIVAAAMMAIFGAFKMHEVVLYSMATGFGGTLAVFGINWGAGMAFRWKHFEVKFTIRQPDQDRRDLHYTEKRKPSRKGSRGQTRTQDHDHNGDENTN